MMIRKSLHMPEQRVADASPAAAARPGPRRLLAIASALAGSPLVRCAFVAGALAMAGYAVARDWTRIWSAAGSIGALAGAAALASVLAALLATAQLWRLLLASLGSPLSARAAARILFVGQLGKYLPGSLWPVVAQMELGRSYRVPRARSASTSILLLLLALISGLLTALLALPFAAGPLPYRWALLAAPFLLAMLHPRILNRILARLLRMARQPALDTPLTAGTLARALAWAFGSWLCYGLQIWILAVRLGAPPGRTAALAVGGFAFAWSAGFLVVFAPAGAGVRDVLLLLLLSPVLGIPAATAVALVSRLLLTAADVLTAGIALGVARPPRRSPAEPGAVPEPGPGPEPGLVPGPASLPEAGRPADAG
jgi:uncharacterized membrane protein YbhN (UPF0104 family)